MLRHFVGMCLTVLPTINSSETYIQGASQIFLAHIRFFTNYFDYYGKIQVSHLLQAIIACVITFFNLARFFALFSSYLQNLVVVSLLKGDDLYEKANNHWISRYCLCRAVWPRNTEVGDISIEPVKIAVTADVAATLEEQLQIINSADSQPPELAGTEESKAEKEQAPSTPDKSGQ